MHSRLSRKAPSSYGLLLCSAGPLAKRDNLSLAWDPWQELAISAGVSLCPSGPVSILVPDSAEGCRVGWFACLLPFCSQHFLGSLQDVL